MKFFFEFKSARQNNNRLNYQFCEIDKDMAKSGKSVGNRKKKLNTKNDENQHQEDEKMADESFDQQGPSSSFITLTATDS